MHSKGQQPAMIKKTAYLSVLLFGLIAIAGVAQSPNATRDAIEQPEKVMQVTGVIMDRDPAKVTDNARHFLTRGQVEEIVGRSVFELVRVETFLRDHNLYILKAKS
jgi:hypothetical protein